jgi:cysteine desulfurase
MKNAEREPMELLKKRYYFDHNATTPVRPEVIEAMLPYLTERYGNASSVHSFGREARDALETSRGRIASLIGAERDELYFTGCGTESDNIALAGYLPCAPAGRNTIVTTRIEHSAILRTASSLERKGYRAVYVGVDSRSLVDIDELRNAVGPDTALVSVMHANNETGVIEPIAEIAEIAHAAGALFHTDAVQSAGKVPLNVGDSGIDMLSMSAHKLNAQKGIGALYLRRGITVSPLTWGGHHEHGIRPGTENVAGAVGFAKAMELAVTGMKSERAHLSALRDRLEREVGESIQDTLFNGRGVERLPGTSNMSFPGVDGEALLISMDMKGIAVSTGSACSAGEVEPSHVLTAMGIDPRTATSSLRFSMGFGSTEEGIDHILDVLPDIVRRLRNVSANIAG